MQALVEVFSLEIDAAGRVSYVAGLSFLSPEDAVFARMLSGWRNQQLSRNLSLGTIEGRERLVVRFHESTNEYPWQWMPGHVDDFFGDLRAVHAASLSTIRSYQSSLRSFCEYVSSASYGWVRVCEQLFGTHPAQICFDWNTAAHVQDNESRPGKRAFTRSELQRFFDRADDEVTRIASLGRKGWLSAFRDSVLLKTAYGWGLRCNEARHLQSIDFSRNPHTREFGRYGVLEVRYGKAMKGSPPKSRSVLTVFDWSAEVIADWMERGRPYMPEGLDLFPSERGTLVSYGALLARLRRYCDELSLSPVLDIHSLRRSYASHLIEAGMDPLFVQNQLGHEHASTTSLYTFVTGDYRTSTLRRALDSTVRDALEGRQD